MMTDQLPKLEKAVEVTTIMHSMLQALRLGAMMTGQLAKLEKSKFETLQLIWGFCPSDKNESFKI